MIVRELITLLGFRTDPAGVRQYERTTDRMVNRSNAAATAVGTTLGMLAANFVASIGSMVSRGAQALVAAGDATITASNLINSGLDDVSQGTEVMEALYQASRRTGVELTASASSFANLAPALRLLNVDAAGAIELIDGLQRSLMISGRTASEVSSVMRQFGQAVGSGVLRGDEFNSLMENGGKLMRIFAEEMGKPVSALREMAEKGQLTTDVFLPAMQRATRRLSTEFDGLEVTAARANAVLKVTATRLFGDFMRTFKVSERIGALVMRFDAFLERLRLMIPLIALYIESIGGMDRVTQLFATAALALLILNLRTALTMITAVSRAMFVLAARILAPVAAVGLLVLALDDLRVWMNGGDSLIGRALGPFEDFITGLPDKIREALGGGTLGDLGAALFVGFRDTLKLLDDMFKMLRDSALALKELLFGDFQAGWAGLQAAVSAFTAEWGLLIAGIVGSFAAIRMATVLLSRMMAARAAGAAGAAGAGAGAGAAGAAGAGAAGAAGAGAAGAAAPATAGLAARLVPGIGGLIAGMWPTRAADATLTGNPEILRSLQNAAQPVGMNPPSMAPAQPSTVTTNNEVHAEIEITVTAPAFTPEELTARVQSALRDSTQTLMERVGRSINTAMPRAEGATQ